MKAIGHQWVFCYRSEISQCGVCQSSGAFCYRSEISHCGGYWSSVGILFQVRDFSVWRLLVISGYSFTDQSYPSVASSIIREYSVTGQRFPSVESVNYQWVILRFGDFPVWRLLIISGYSVTDQRFPSVEAIYDSGFKRSPGESVTRKVVTVAQILQKPVQIQPKDIVLQAPNVVKESRNQVWYFKAYLMKWLFLASFYDKMVINFHTILIPLMR